MADGSKGRRVGVKLMGKTIDVKMSNIGGSPDSRDDVVTLVKNAGFAKSLGTDEIGTQSMGVYMRKIGELESEYGALKAIPTVLAGADGQGFYAAAGGTESGAVMILHRGAMGNAAKHAKAKAGNVADGWSMPTNGKLTANATYTVAHEYGHLLQNALYQNAVKSGYTGSDKQYQKKVFKEIDTIAVSKYKGSGSQMSRYGHYNAAEFFAESFAGLNSGGSNAYTKAIHDWLKDNQL